MRDPIRAEAVPAAVKALSTKRWGSRGTSAHRAHRFHADCEVCQGNVEAIAKVAVEAAAPFMAGAGSPATCPSVASESTESTQDPSAAPVYRPGVEEPAESLTALRERIHLLDGMRQANLEAAGAALQRAERAEAAITRVRAAHPLVDDGFGPECRGCGNPVAGIVLWPCPTIRALDGAGAVPGEHTGGDRA